MTPRRRRHFGIVALAIWIAGALLPYASAMGSNRFERKAARPDKVEHIHQAEPATKAHPAHHHFDVVSGEDAHSCSHCTAACFEGRGHVCMTPKAASHPPESGDEIMDQAGTAAAPCVKPLPCPMGDDEPFGMAFAPMQFRALPPADPWTMPVHHARIESTEPHPTNGHNALISPPPESLRPIA